MKFNVKVGPKARKVSYWIVTALFCLQMGFTAYAQLCLPQVAEAFAHLGFPDYFRVQLSWAKLVGVVLLLAPVPARLREWAYAGFAIDLGSALVAHRAVGDGAEAWSWAAATGVLWGLSYLFWRIGGRGAGLAASSCELASAHSTPPQSDSTRRGPPTLAADAVEGATCKQCPCARGIDVLW